MFFSTSYCIIRAITLTSSTVFSTDNNSSLCITSHLLERSTTLTLLKKPLLLNISIAVLHKGFMMSSLNRNECLRPSLLLRSSHVTLYSQLNNSSAAPGVFNLITDFLPKSYCIESDTTFLETSLKLYVLHLILPIAKLDRVYTAINLPRAFPGRSLEFLHRLDESLTLDLA